MSNMLGDFFLGEGLLGADPDTATDGGNGYGNTANMLGQFMLGEPMLGADPSNGSGSGTAVAGPAGNFYQLTPSTIVGSTTVTATAREALLLRPATIAAHTTIAASLTQSSLRATTSAGRTTVTGRLNEVLAPTGTIHAGTTVSGNLTRVQTLSGTNISGSTSVTASLTRSVFRGSNIFCSTNVAASLALRELIRPEAIRAGTTTHTAALGIASPFKTTQNITCATTLTANLTYQSRLSGGSAVCGTVITVTKLDRSNFYGQPIVCATTVTASNLYVMSRYFGTIVVGTTVRVVEGGFRRVLAGLTTADVQAIHAGTSVKGRVYVVPQDFVPVYINTQTSLVVTLRLAFHFSAAVTDHTAVTGNGLFGRVTLVAKVVACKTTVKGGARYGNGGAINGFGFLVAALGVAFQLKKAVVGGIFCHTKVVAPAPKNGTAGHAWGGTRFALTYGRPDGELGFYVNDSNNGHYEGYNYVYYYNTHFPTLTIFIGLFPKTSAGRTQLSSLVVPSRAYYHDGKGAAPYYGPFGYVNMNRVPKGDLGLGDFIDAQTVVGASMLALRHRILQILSVVGLEVPSSFTFTGDAVRGSGTRNVTGGTATRKIEAERAPVAQNAYYV